MKRTYWLRGLALCPLPLALCLRFVAVQNPQTVESVFARGIYPALAAPVSRLMGLCPVPVVELLIPGGVVLLITGLIRRRFFRVVAALCLVLAVFLGGWGLNYYRLPLEQTLDLSLQGSTTQELTALCQALVKIANENHTQPPANLLDRVPDAMNRAAQTYPIPQGNFARPKRALSSGLLTRGLIEGITSPFTAEALVNGDIPAISLPFAACHEAAHIRGFAREEDANLIGFAACMASGEPFFRYSGALGGLAHALTALRNEDAQAYAMCYDSLDAAVQADLKARAAFWATYEKQPAAEIAQTVNDAYLQAASGGEQSTKSYGRMVDLLLALMRKEGTLQ